MLSPIVSTLISYPASLFRSRLSLCVENFSPTPSACRLQTDRLSPAAPPDGPDVLGLTLAFLVRLAGDLGVRPAADRACVAAQTVPRPLAPPEPAGNTWPACSCQGAARPDSPDVASQSDMGFAPDSRRT